MQLSKVQLCLRSKVQKLLNTFFWPLKLFESSWMESTSLLLIPAPALTKILSEARYQDGKSRSTLKKQVQIYSVKRVGSLAKIFDIVFIAWCIMFMTIMTICYTAFLRHYCAALLTGKICSSFSMRWIKNRIGIMDHGSWTQYIIIFTIIIYSYINY